MGKILEQDDIDSLFSGEIVEEPQEKTDVKIYDFRHPDRLSKEQNRLLHSIMENFCRFTATFISASTRSLVEMNVSSVDQLTYNEYLFSMSEPIALYIVRFKELGGRSIFEFSPRFVLFLVDRMLGGSGQMPDEDRDLTAIEERVSLNVIEKFFTNFSSVWKEVFSFTSIFETFESNPRLVQIAPPGESVVLISINMNIDGENSLFNLCIPFIVLQEPLRNLTSRTWNIDLKDDKKFMETRHKLKQRMMRTTLDATVILGKARTTLGDLAQMKEGDELRLFTKHESPLLMKIGEKKKFYVEPGFQGERKAVRIVNHYK